jgi:hypothetical protein
MYKEDINSSEIVAKFGFLKYPRFAELFAMYGGKSTEDLTIKASDLDELFAYVEAAAVSVREDETLLALIYKLAQGPCDPRAKLRSILKARITGLPEEGIAVVCPLRNCGVPHYHEDKDAASQVR